MWALDAASRDRRRLNAVMAAASEEPVAIKPGALPGDQTEITVNCPDKVGLGCDLARIVFEFGLTVIRGDLQTDGRWCFVVFWVVPNSSRPVRWPLLRHRLSAAAPAPRRALFEAPPPPESLPKQMCILQVCSGDRAGLLNDAAQLLWELELTIHRVKVSTSPEGKAIDLFFVTDNRTSVPSNDRIADVCDQVKKTLRETTFCTLTVAGPDSGIMECSPASHLSPAVAECLFSDEFNACEDISEREILDSAGNKIRVEFAIDNVTSPGHTVLQISCKDRKGLLYDSMRTLKDANLQVAYGRITNPKKNTIELDLFVLQPDGKKILDPQKQKSLLQLMAKETQHPIRLVVTPRGPDTELLVATPIEMCGRGRPRVLYDVTLALKTLEICIFKADISRHSVGDRLWEVYRFLLIDTPQLNLSSNRTQNLIADRVKNILMG